MLDSIADSSGGISRIINNYCFSALALGSILKQSTLDVDVMNEVAADFDIGNLAPRNQEKMLMVLRLPSNTNPTNLYTLKSLHEPFC